MVKLLSTLLLLLSITLIGSKNSLTKTTQTIVNIETTHIKAKEALQFCKSNKLNTNFCILIDMSMHSGLKRFFIYNFKKDSITNSFLVTHGCCDNPWNTDISKENPKFSNLDGSHCS
jgi:L,D-transpeptidase catalytic domain